MGSASGSLSRRSLCAGAISLLPAAAALLPAPLLSGCANAPATRQSSDAGSEPSTGSTFAFDTYCTFTVYGDDSAPALLAKECTRYDKLFNLYDESSDIARVNAAQGAAVTVDPATLDLLEQALAFCASAQGLFDITIGAVSTLWDFSEGVRPSDADVANALPHVNWRCVEFDAEQATVRLTDSEAKIDLGGIAKGYVADRLCELLERETHATAAVLSLGGNIALLAKNPTASPGKRASATPTTPAAPPWWGPRAWTAARW